MNVQLTVSHIYKSYNGNQVLEDCSFSFDKSGIYILMGPNGSGKSTLLRICALLEDPDKGEINYLSGGSVLKKDIELRRKITLVLPRIGVFNTTVFKNIAYGLKIRGITGNEVNDRTYKALECVGLMHKREQNALTLSSGETQRLGIARATVLEPEILFLDEPTAFVDVKSKKIIEDNILQMRNNGHSMVIITTHDRVQAERLGDRLLLIGDGKIISS
jgi:tungstate transport system ATP-binding protein